MTKSSLIVDLSLEKRIRAVLHSLKGVGSGRLRQLIARFGSAVNAWERISEVPEYLDEPWARQIILKHRSNPQELEEQLDAKGIKIIIPEEEGYPDLLRQLADAPPLLYYKGYLSPGKESLGIVGARKATAYGRAAAEALAKEVSEQDIIVISGLARGIDTAAHRGALAGGGITWAIMGCGLDYMYPPENQKLADDIIANQGAIWSEFNPAMPPEPRLFPMRNRLISGMSRGVVVVEAALKSGALITVDFALEQGREVFAIPGPIFSQTSKGTNNLIRQGAKLVEGYEDILAEIPAFAGLKITAKTTEPQNSGCHRQQAKTEPFITPDQVKILEMLSDQPTHIDQITLNSEVAPEQIPLVLLELQLAGQIEQLSGQYYVLAYKC